MSPHGRFKVVGPTGRPAEAGRLADGAHRQQLPGVGLVWAWPCLNTGARPVLSGFGMVLSFTWSVLNLNRCSDIFCDFMSGQSVHATCILAPKYNLHFLKGKVWFRDLIE